VAGGVRWRRIDARQTPATPGVELGKVVRVAGDDVAVGYGAGGLIGLLDAAEALAGVVGEVALAQLTVVDDVDAHASLVLDDVAHGGGQGGHEVGSTALARGVHLLERGGSRNRSGV